MKYYVFLLIIVFLVIGCKKETFIKSNVFSIENARPINLGALEKQDFIKKSDMPLVYEKQNKDTLVTLEINKDLKVIHSKTWKVKIDEVNMNYVWAFFEKNYCSSTRSFSQYYSKTMSSFHVYSYIDNNIFLCKLLKEKEQDYLEIKYRVPLKK